MRPLEDLAYTPKAITTKYKTVPAINQRLQNASTGTF